jgi:hypothetical protein
MGVGALFSHRFSRPVFGLGVSLIAIFTVVEVTGCQTAAPGVSTALIRHQALVDFSGLKESQTVEALKVNCAPPETWEAMPLKKMSLFTHQQWRSPTHNTGVGVAYIHLPIPLPLKTLLWFAKNEYTKKANDGKIIAQWTDSLGRSWFEGENNKYHVRGYAAVSGTDAWIVYFGHKTATPPSAAELSLAARSLDTIIPQGKLAAAQMQASAAR